MSPYDDGYQAGQRTDKYEGTTRIPECPYTDEKQSKEWWEGFGDGTEDFITWNLSDY